MFLRRATATVLLSALVLPCSADELRLRFSGGLSTGYDDNVGAAQDGFETEGSAFYSALLAADSMWVVNNWFGLMLRGQLNGDAYDRYDELSNLRAMTMLRASFKPGSGFFTPVVSLWGSAARLQYQSEIRRGDELRGGVLGTLQLTTQIGARAEVKAFRRRAEGEVFDLSGHAAVLGLNWGYSPRLSLTGALEMQWGDSFSTAAPTVRVLRAAEAVEADDAFGGVARNQFAYRFDATTRIAALGLNYRITRDLAFDAQLQAVSVDADFGNEYERLIGIAGLLLKF